jgi:hypothetical protein
LISKKRTYQKSSSQAAENKGVICTKTAQGRASQ